MKQLTRAEAIRFNQSGAWRKLTPFERARFQLHQERLCMPFDEFRAAMQEALGRRIFVHEFGTAYVPRLKAELAAVEKRLNAKPN